MSCSSSPSQFIVKFGIHLPLCAKDCCKKVRHQPPAPMLNGFTTNKPPYAIFCRSKKQQSLYTHAARPCSPWLTLKIAAQIDGKADGQRCPGDMQLTIPLIVLYIYIRTCSTGASDLPNAVWFTEIGTMCRSDTEWGCTAISSVEEQLMPKKQG